MKIKDKPIFVFAMGAGFIDSFHSFALVMQKVIRECQNIPIMFKCILNIDRKALKRSSTGSIIYMTKNVCKFNK